MAELRKAPGMRERSPGVWELIVEAGRDPVSGRRRQVSRLFRGNVRDAKKARAELIVEVSKGRHSGTGATMDNLFGDWIVELRRKGRSPNTIEGYERTYRRNIRPTLGSVAVRKVTTKMLSDLYGAHQARGLAPRTVYQIHACVSSMMTQAGRWGWRDSNPAQWADPPSIPNTSPVVPTPAEITALVRAAEESRRPEHARAILVAATTGLRRAELCALRRDRNLDPEHARLTIAWSILDLAGRRYEEIPTKDRRVRRIALDDFTFSVLRAQLAMMEERAAAFGVELVPDAYLFSEAVDGSIPWSPSTITQYFARLRARVGLDHLDFHYLRKFMETYGQNLGFSPVQVAMRAGHDPSVAAKHCTGSVERPTGPSAALWPRCSSRRWNRGSEHAHACAERSMPEPSRMSFRPGELLERSCQTTSGVVDVLAEIVVEGPRLELRDIAVYPHGAGRLEVLPAQMLGWLRDVAADARAAGFDELRINGHSDVRSTAGP